MIESESEVSRETLHQAMQVAKTDSCVLITGETGTGKELLAQYIHEHSSRCTKPLIKVDCSSLPESLIESELFGHEVGAFTGAQSKRLGRFELAHQGTVFLDEIGELPLEMQAKLLRVLQEREFWRLGATAPTQVDMRVLAATNRDLAAAVQHGQFRSDLYYRLAVFPIHLPPLRQRPTDILPLAWHFIQQKQTDLHRQIEQIELASQERLLRYPWPGNIRELENVIERALILTDDATLRVGPLDTIAIVDATNSPRRSITLHVDELLRQHIISVLQACHWRIKGRNAAAERLGMHPSTLRFRMKKLGISRAPTTPPNSTNQPDPLGPADQTTCRPNRD